MRAPPFPFKLVTPIVQANGKATRQEVMELISELKKARDACNTLEARVYSVTWERDRLKAENEFLCRLINVKMEE